MAKVATKKVQVNKAAVELLANFLNDYNVEENLVTVEHASEYLASLEEGIDYSSESFFNYLLDTNVIETDDDEGEQEEEEKEEDSSDDDNARAVPGISIENADATNIGRKIDKADEVRNYIHESIDVDEKRRRLPANVAFALKQSMSDEDMAVVPRPNSKIADNANLYDIGKPGTTPWFATAFDSMEEGIRLNKAIDVLDAALSPNSPVPIPFGIYPNYKGQTPKWLESERDMLKQRRNAGIKALRGAFNVLFRFDDIEEQLNNVFAEFRTVEHEGKEVIERTTAPIRIYTRLPSKKRKGEFDIVDKFFGINAFLRATTKDHLKLVKATTDHFNNFMPPKVTRGKKDEKLQPVATVPQAVHVVEEMILSFKQDQSFRAGMRSYAMQDENAPFLYALSELRAQIGLICDQPSAVNKIRAFEAALKAADKTDKPAA